MLKGHMYNVHMYIMRVHISTVFPQKLAMATFHVVTYFKASFDAVTIRGWIDFDGICRDWHAHAYTASTMSPFMGGSRGGGGFWGCNPPQWSESQYEMQCKWCA